MYRSVQSLQERYGIVRSALYKRMEHLCIRPQRIGSRAYVSEQQFELLEQLDEALNSGQCSSAAEFAVSKGITSTSTRPSLDYLRELETAVANNWLLRGSEVAMLLNVSQQQVDESPAAFEDAGFTFLRQGNRLDGETAWRVYKTLPQAE